ncbi:MAG: glycosyltransferase family 4 protein [Flavobacteriales bacterium]|nr:glycosyltransferase family 4 protein [Flavobacteriales bacterium]
MNVCHITSAHPDGDVRIFHKECVSLANVGHNVSLIIPNTTSRIERGVRIIGVKSPYNSRKERMTKTVQDVLNQALEINADIYHLHDPELLKIVKHLKRKGKKVIYDVHEDLPRQILSKAWINPFFRKIISRIVEIYENKVAKKCDGIVAATPFIRDRFLKINPNTTDINNYPLLEELLNQQTESDNRTHICYIGGITKIRGLAFLVDALQEVDTKLYLAGDFESESFRDELSRKDGWSKVEHLGFISRSESLQIKSQCFAGMVLFLPEPNHVTAQPNKMFEYMAARLPVIASDFPLWKSIIEDNNCGICVDPQNFKAIAQAIKQLQENPGLVKVMGKNGHRLVTERYNWEKEADKLIAFYQQFSA